MSSSVYFKFKSQKEPTRVEFDGTGISVFELKREIIVRSGLGDGTDFDLAIYTEDGRDEYDDDTTIIPRSTTVIARRLPPMKPGAGRAARYVSGKMPVHAKNASRREQTAKATAKATSSAIEQMNNAMTEDEKLAAMFAAQSEQWNAQQEEMSHQTPIYKPGSRRPANVPDHDPPAGYICYRCGEKGHWIQMCPTNDNPEFDNRPRVKRTTGIPRSFLKTVDKAAVLAQAADEDVKAPSGIMVNADGDFVIAEPDKASWEKFQAKTKSGAAAQEVAALADKELQEKGLECPIDKKLFIDPMKTPCCGKTYCNDCITNALIESDFVCPGCQSEGVLIDDLKADEETEQKMAAYQKEKEEKKAQEKAAGSKEEAGSAGSPSSTPADGKKTTDSNETTAAVAGSTTTTAAAAATTTSTTSLEAKDPKQTTSAASSTKPSKSPEPGVESDSTLTNGKKRPADTDVENPKIPKAPKAMQQAAQNQAMQMMNNGMGGGGGGMEGMGDMSGFNMGFPGMGGMGGMGMNGMGGMGMGGMNGMPMMPFGGMGMMNYGMGMGNMGMGNMGMGMGNMGNMNMGMMNPMMGMNGMNGNGFNGGGFNGGGGGFNGNNNYQQGWGNNGGGNNGGGYGRGGYMNNHANNNNNRFNNMNGNGGPNGGNFQNGGPNGGGGLNNNGMNNNNIDNNGNNNTGADDDAYFRKPVNPHRHFNKPKRIRPSDYREL